MYSYAVYSQKDGQWWVEKNFPINRKDEAVELAEEIARSSPYISVKVVRENYDDSSGTFTEATIFKIDGKPTTNSPPARPAAAPAAPPKAKAAAKPKEKPKDKSPKEKPAEKPRDKPKEPEKPPEKAAEKPPEKSPPSRTPPATSAAEPEPPARAGRTVLQVLLLTVPLGIATGIAVSALILYLAYKSGVVFIINAVINPYIAFGYFFITSVATTVWLIIKIEPELLMAEGGAEPGLPRGPVRRKRKKPKKALAPPLPPMPDLDTPPASTDPDPDPEKKEEPTPPVDEAKDEEPKKQEPKPPRSDIAALEANGGNDLASLFARSVALTIAPGQPATRAQLFAFHLYLAGLSEEFARAMGWNDQERRIHMFRLLTPITSHPERTASFTMNYDDYMATPHNLTLKETGAATARSFLAGVPGAEKVLASALRDWMGAASTVAKQSQTAVVMFTDIVGSTDFAQTHGNEKALQQVRAHDQLIAYAFDQQKGTVVKHTGDGVMASFFTSAEAVRAAILIQKGAVAHTRAHPELPVRLRVGISDGKAIRENDDLFGSAVQLAARLCAAAQPEQIIVAQAVVKGCEGAGVGFFSAGQKQLKGFPEPLELFGVYWEADNR